MSTTHLLEDLRGDNLTRCGLGYQARHRSTGKSTEGHSRLPQLVKQQQTRGQNEEGSDSPMELRRQPVVSFLSPLQGTICPHLSWKVSSSFQRQEGEVSLDTFSLGKMLSSPEGRRILLLPSDFNQKLTRKSPCLA